MASGAGQKSIGWWLRWVILPLGRLLRALGFELRFWFTLPIPYHPLIAFALPFVPLLLVGWGAVALAQGAVSPVSWWALLVTGLVLAVPLSIPVINIIAFVFRVPLLQAFCFLGAMILLGAEATSGSRPVEHGVLPLAFFLLFLVQRIGGPILLARVERDNAAFVPVQAGEGLVRLHLPLRGERRLREAQRIWREKGLAQLLVRTQALRPRGRLFLRPTAEARALLREMVPERDLRSTSSGLSVDPLDLSRLRPEVDVRVEPGSWLLKGPLTLARVRSGGLYQRLWGGRPAVIGRWPLFTLFYDVRMFSGSPGNGRWYAGFVPGAATILQHGSDHRLMDAVFAEANPSAEVGPELLRSQLEPLASFFARRAAAEVRRRRQNRRLAVAELERFAETGKISPKLVTADFAEEPELLCGKGPVLCAALRTAKAKRQQIAAMVAAKHLSALPQDEFVTLEEELLALLGSRILALEWQLTPDLDLAPLPKNCPKFGEIAGFGLMSRVPLLWERLGELGPKAARITALFIKEVGERPMLVAARDGFLARGIRLPDV